MATGVYREESDGQAGDSGGGGCAFDRGEYGDAGRVPGGFVGGDYSASAV